MSSDISSDPQMDTQYLPEPLQFLVSTFLLKASRLEKKHAMEHMLRAEEQVESARNNRQPDFLDAIVYIMPICP